LSGQLFEDFFAGLQETDEAEFCRRYADPALILEPYDESMALTARTAAHRIGGEPDEDQRRTTRRLSRERLLNEVASGDAASAHKRTVEQYLHPGATLVWLTKSERNQLKGIVTLGRAPTNDIIIAHPNVSKSHALFHRRDDGWLLEDQDSTNKTHLNRKPLPPNERVALPDGAKVELASCVAGTFVSPQRLWRLCQLMRRMRRETT
jgi:hypothetical protein